jgi:HPt (histidine-containing phosphotransfer) domain-containing protein
MSDIFDKAGALGRVAGDTALLLELLELSQNHVETSVPLLVEAAARGEAGEVQRLAHSLRSAFGNLGALKVYDIVTELERVAAARQLPQCSALIPVLASSIDEFLATARESCESPDQTG